jgi:hypothetical protein
MDLRFYKLYNPMQQAWQSDDDGDQRREMLHCIIVLLMQHNPKAKLGPRLVQIKLSLHSQRPVVLQYLPPWCG